MTEPCFIETSRFPRWMNVVLIASWMLIIGFFFLFIVFLTAAAMLRSILLAVVAIAFFACALFYTEVIGRMNGKRSIGLPMMLLTASLSFLLGLAIIVLSVISVLQCIRRTVIDFEQIGLLMVINLLGDFLILSGIIAMGQWNSYNLWCRSCIPVKTPERISLGQHNFP